MSVICTSSLSSVVLLSMPSRSLAPSLLPMRLADASSSVRVLLRRSSSRSCTTDCTESSRFAASESLTNEVFAVAPAHTNAHPSARVLSRRSSSCRTVLVESACPSAWPPASPMALLLSTSSRSSISGVARHFAKARAPASPIALCDKSRNVSRGVRSIPAARTRVFSSSMCELRRESARSSAESESADAMPRTSVSVAPNSPHSNPMPRSRRPYSASSAVTRPRFETTIDMSRCDGSCAKVIRRTYGAATANVRRSSASDDALGLNPSSCSRTCFSK
eukprot:Amastigsp_a4517_23.p2 type:complete len:278 gc:universal Amastigsp_a4517_23:96-929(+)